MEERSTGPRISGVSHAREHPRPRRPNKPFTAGAVFSLHGADSVSYMSALAIDLRRTAGWLFSRRRRLVPADTIEQIDGTSGVIGLRVDRENIRSFL